MIHLDVLLDGIGQYGLAQIVMCLLVGYYQCSNAMNSLATVFIQQAPQSYRFVIFVFNAYRIIT